jgi:hypothetical protein
VYNVHVAQELRILDALLDYADVFNNKRAATLLSYKSLDYAISI